MKKTRILALVLALLMLMGTAALFSSCAGEQDGDVLLSGGSVTVDLSAYTVIFANGLSKTQATLSLANGFVDRLRAATGAELMRYADNTVEADAAGCEILIGLTDRAESAEALELIDGDGFVIEVTENKIAILGTSHIHLVMAMEYFTERYLSNASGSTLSLYGRALAEELASVTVDEKLELGVAVVVEQGLASDAASSRDLPAKLADDFYTVMGDNLFTSKKSKSALLLKKADDEEITIATELLVGNVDRDLASECRATLAATEYGFFVREGSVVLTAMNDAALLVGGELVAGLLKDAITITDEERYLKLPVGFTLKRDVNSKWVTDFPKPEGEGITLYNTMDDQNDSLQYYYVGEGIGAESYQGYCNTLLAEGYTVVTENEIEQSLYTTFLDPTGTFSLYVAYNAYAHASEYAYSNKLNAQYQKCIRIVSSPLSSTTLPDAGLLTQNPDYTRVTTSSITALELYKDTVGMGYVITLEDGRLVVFDGGFVAAPAPADLWNLLRATNERITGQPTSVENPVRIAAWILTHSHSDHSSAFLRVLSSHGSKIRMDYILGNFPSETSAYRSSGTDIMDMGKEGQFERYQALVPGGFKFIKVHAGQKFYLANIEIEILTTYEDLNPARISTGNDTNTVTRITMYNTNEQKERVGDPVTSVWLGDANALQSRYLCTMFGDYLESDMVQLAHHGNTGCEKDLYTLVNAKVLWFPVDYWRVELFAIAQTHPTLRDINLHALTLPRMQYVYASGNDNTISNDYNLCLPFSAVTGQPDYDAIFEAITGKTLAYDNISAYNNVDRFIQAKE